MADRIVQNIETKNQLCLFGENLNINFLFSYLGYFRQNSKLSDGLMKLNYNKIIVIFRFILRVPKYLGPVQPAA